MFINIPRLLFFHSSFATFFNNPTFANPFSLDCCKEHVHGERESLSNENTPPDEENVYNVEYIITKMKRGTKYPKYWVKWIGWPHQSNTWQAKGSFLSPQLVEKFEERWIKDQALIREKLRNRERSDGEEIFVK